MGEQTIIPLSADVSRAPVSRRTIVARRRAKRVRPDRECGPAGAVEEDYLKCTEVP
jgi:hypothetical protein